MDDVEYRSVIKFVIQKMAPSEILLQLQEVYNEMCPSNTIVYYWIREFCGGRQSVFTGTSKSGRPTEIADSKEEEWAALILKNRHIRIDDAAEILRVIHGTMCNLLSNLDVRKLCSRFLAKFITSKMAERRFTACRANLELFEELGDRFLESIMTEDEAPLNLFIRMTRPESSEWCFPEEAAPRKLKIGTSHRRCSTLSVFWSRNGILHLDILDKSRTTNGAYYAYLLEAAFSQLRRSQLRNKYLLHHNPLVHKARVVQEKNCQLKLKGGLQHPPYSPDLASSDFCLFRHLKKKLRGQAFSSPSDVE